MKTLLMSTAAVLTLAVPAMAQNTLAAGLGVEPGMYSVAEIVAANDALQNDQPAVARAILARDANPVTATAQLAAGAGAEGLTASQLVLLNHAQSDDDATTIHAIVAGPEVISSQGGASVGTAQIAQSLELDAGAMGLSALTEAYFDEVSD